MHGQRTRRSRRLVVLAVAGLLLLAVVVLSLAIGARSIDVATILQALTAPDLTNPAHAVIWDGRIPRTLLAIVAGAGIAAAGALIQALTRNPLADPGVLGVNAGASFAVVLAVGVFGVQSVFGHIWFALVGAAIATVGVYLIGRGRSADPVRLVLAGVALSAVLEGIAQGLALLNPQAFDIVRGRAVGTVDIGRLEPAVLAGAFVLGGLVIGAVAAVGLNALAMGDEVAAALGARVGLIRVLTITAVTVLAGAASAVAGVIVFLGLMVPHLARRLCGPDHRWVFAYSIVLGPTILLLADVIGRVVLPGELPAGVVVAFVGAPVLVALARARKVIAL